MGQNAAALNQTGTRGAKSHKKPIDTFAALSSGAGVLCSLFHDQLRDPVTGAKLLKKTEKQTSFITL